MLINLWSKEVNETILEKTNCLSNIMITYFNARSLLGTYHMEIIQQWIPQISHLRNVTMLLSSSNYFDFVSLSSNCVASYYIHPFAFVTFAYVNVIQYFVPNIYSAIIFMVNILSKMKIFFGESMNWLVYNEIH